MSCMAVVVPSHPYNAGTERVGFTDQHILLAPSPKHREMLGESREG